MTDLLSSDPLERSPPSGHATDPRATLIHLPDRPDVTAELWVGGSYTAIGGPLHKSDLHGAWLIDCAGELPDDFRDAASACFVRVFEDLEWVPPLYDRIDALARQVAQALSGTAPQAARDSELPAEPPERVYVICKQGFNRSALVAGRILRELGVPASRVVEEIRRRRPGSLTNETFVRLIHE